MWKGERCLTTVLLLSGSLLFLSPPFFFLLLPLPLRSLSLLTSAVRTKPLTNCHTHSRVSTGGNLIQKIIPTADENMGKRRRRREIIIIKKNREGMRQEQN
jgi:hypothetical protein